MEFPRRWTEGGKGISVATSSPETIMTHEQNQRRHLVASNIEDAVRSVRDKEATGFILRGVGEVHVKGQYATIHQGIVTVFDEVDDVVSRRTVLVDDVVAVDTNWGGYDVVDEVSMRPQAYVAPSAMGTTVMQLTIAALLRGRDPIALFADQHRDVLPLAVYAMTNELPRMLWDMPLRQHQDPLSSVVALMPGIVRLRDPLGETSIAHPGNVEQALADMRTVGMLMTGRFDPEKGRDGTPVDRALARDGVRETLMHVGPMLTTDEPAARPQLPADVVDTLDTAMVLAATIRRFMRSEPFIERTWLRHEIEHAAESLFTLRD
jgi:hypothetical protein